MAGVCVFLPWLGAVWSKYSGRDDVLEVVRCKPGTLVVFMMFCCASLFSVNCTVVALKYFITFPKGVRVLQYYCPSCIALE